jgi:hypothetical protein
VDLVWVWVQTKWAKGVGWIACSWGWTWELRNSHERLRCSRAARELKIASRSAGNRRRRRGGSRIRRRRRRRRRRKEKCQDSDANTYLYAQFVQLINQIKSNQCLLLACLLLLFFTCTGTRTEGTNWSIEPILALALSVERQTPPFLSLGAKNW